MEVTRLIDLLPYQLSRFPKADALAGKQNGVWKKYATAEIIETVNNLSYGLLHSGIKPGDKVGIIANNRPEWNFVDHACLQIAVADVPLYPTISENDLKFTLNQSSVRFLFVSNAGLYNKVQQIKSDLPALEKIFLFDRYQDLPHWSELLELGRQHPKLEEVNQIRDSIKPDDLATIIYTSGTTGNPKGVMLSHNNLVSNFKFCDVLCPFHESWRALSFLPLNHVYERMLSYLYVYFGVSIYYAESLDTIADNLKEIKPQIFVTVPRLLEKVYDKIVSKGAELKGIKKALFFWALNLGLRYELKGVNGWWYEFQLRIANKLIFSKWREALGGNIQAIASGGAALQPRLARVFHAAKIPVLEGYGLTETSPVIAVNNFQPDSIKFGTVGTVLENVEVKIDSDGEILCKGPNVMLGYYNGAELTAEVIDAEGWFHTGDIGVFENGKFLKITDRKKEIFKTSGGKYIVPQMIENKLKESRFIEQAMVIGENQKFASAFIVPNFAFIRDWAAKKNIAVNSNVEIAASSVIKKRIAEEVEVVNRTLGHYETIKRFELLDQEFSIERNEMTPKLSLRRKIILENYKDKLAKIYKDTE
ncbi:MAG TPA: long-chain fatty acid--CoA ligase [Bacteroidia bacterium]|nr:long-chain fatty acid--CoA ligase [Bacteroidia bacterium]HMU20020.1 long-chain fatty acid--CoA ligase [Bacteroidia bacterium]